MDILLYNLRDKERKMDCGNIKKPFSMQKRAFLYYKGRSLCYASKGTIET